MKTLLLALVCLSLTGCVSVSAKACFGVPASVRSVLPDKVPKDGCPLDFHYSNMQEPTPEPIKQPEPAPKPTPAT